MNKGIFTITAPAAEGLKSFTSNPQQDKRVPRVSRSVSDPEQLGMRLDIKLSGDIEVMSQGKTILLLSPEACDMLGGATLSYKSGESGSKYILSKKH